MPWINAQTVPFRRIYVVSSVPSDGGVFGILLEGNYLLIAESWNLKARLLDLINNVSPSDDLSVVFETCGDPERASRVHTLQTEFQGNNVPSPPVSSASVSGLSFWATPAGHSGNDEEYTKF